MPVYLVLGLIFSMAVAVFAVQNATTVDINVLLWQLKGISLVVVILGSALIGALSAGLFGIVKQIKLKKKIKEYKTLADAQEMELDYLKKKAASQEPVKKSEEPEVSGAE